MKLLLLFFFFVNLSIRKLDLNMNPLINCTCRIILVVLSRQLDSINTITNERRL